MPSESMFLPALALAAGVLSFSSPCTLPLVPGYISYMAGVRAGRGRTLTAALLFVAGFSAVFMGLGAAASGIGALLAENRILLERVAGAVIIFLGLVLLGLLKLPMLEREGRPLLEKVRPGPKGALFLGVAFAFGWTPCIGPVLGSILVLAGSQRTAGSGVLLLLLYSAGLGIPFLAAALLLDRFSRISQGIRRHAGAINAAAGVLLLLMGGLVASGRLQAFTAPVLELYARLKWPPI